MSRLTLRILSFLGQMDHNNNSLPNRVQSNHHLRCLQVQTSCFQMANSLGATRALRPPRSTLRRLYVTPCVILPWPLCPYGRDEKDSYVVKLTVLLGLDSLDSEEN